MMRMGLAIRSLGVCFGERSKASLGYNYHYIVGDNVQLTLAG